MKRLWLVAVGVLFCAAWSQVSAEVQNIRVSGDIRIRGYYVNNLNLTDSGKTVPPETFTDPATGEVTEVSKSANDRDFFLAQRSRVTVEADLEEQVLAVVTVNGIGTWGSEPELSSALPRTQDFEVTLSEAYVQMQEMFYSPVTLKLGRQYLNYGRGLILSSKEYELRYDAARVVYDQYPFTVDLVYAALVEGLQSIFDRALVGSDSDMFFANLRFEPDNSLLQDAEMYVGYMDQGTGASPGIVGLRGDILPQEAWTAWGEVAYEFGDADQGGDLRAWMFDLGTEYIMSQSALEPKLTLGYTYAQGDRDVERMFVPWGDYEIWGYVFSPQLSNIHILKAAAEVLPVENLSLGLDIYYYLQDDPVAMVMGSPYKQNGGVNAVTNGDDRQLGAEFDFVVGYDYSQDVRTQFYVGAFFPDDAYSGSSGDDEAIEVRGEVQVNF